MMKKSWEFYVQNNAPMLPFTKKASHDPELLPIAQEDEYEEPPGPAELAMQTITIPTPVTTALIDQIMDSLIKYKEETYQDPKFVIVSMDDYKTLVGQASYQLQHPTLPKTVSVMGVELTIVMFPAVISSAGGNPYHHIDLQKPVVCGDPDFDFKFLAGKP